MSLKRPKTSSSDDKTRAERLAIVRDMVGYNLIELANKCHMGYTTMREYEKGTRLLSPKKAKVIVEVLQQEGISCEVSWLLHGSGNLPTFIHQNSHGSAPIPMLEQEIALFRSGHPNALILKIKDDAMYPFLCVDDQVGGVCLSTRELDSMDGQYCIIHSKAYGSICRWVQKIAHTDLFNCQAINLSAKFKKPITLKLDQIINAAPVIRFWKKT